MAERPMPHAVEFDGITLYFKSDSYGEEDDAEIQIFNKNPKTVTPVTPPHFSRTLYNPSLLETKLDELHYLFTDHEVYIEHFVPGRHIAVDIHRRGETTEYYRSDTFDHRPGKRLFRALYDALEGGLQEVIFVPDTTNNEFECVSFDFSSAYPSVRYIESDTVRTESLLLVYPKTYPLGVGYNIQEIQYSPKGALAETCLISCFFDTFTTTVTLPYSLGFNPEKVITDPSLHLWAQAGFTNYVRSIRMHDRQESCNA